MISSSLAENYLQRTYYRDKQRIDEWHSYKQRINEWHPSSEPVSGQRDTVTVDTTVTPPEHRDKHNRPIYHRGPTKAGKGRRAGERRRAGRSRKQDQKCAEMGRRAEEGDAIAAGSCGSRKSRNNSNRRRREDSDSVSDELQQEEGP